jgi:hypothetical protein
MSKALRHLRPPAPLVAVSLGVVTVVLIYHPKALIPRPPYWPWFMLLFAVALFGVVLQLGLEDGLDDVDEGEQFSARAMRWRAAGLAYVLGVVASIGHLASVWLLDRLDRAAV